jgi:hypothetical protein
VTIADASELTGATRSRRQYHQSESRSIERTTSPAGGSRRRDWQARHRWNCGTVRCGRSLEAGVRSWELTEGTRIDPSLSLHRVFALQACGIAARPDRSAASTSRSAPARFQCRLKPRHGLNRRRSSRPPTRELSSRNADLLGQVDQRDTQLPRIINDLLQRLAEKNVEIFLRRSLARHEPIPFQNRCRFGSFWSQYQEGNWIKYESCNLTDRTSVEAFMPDGVSRSRATPSLGPPTAPETMTESRSPTDHPRLRIPPLATPRPNAPQRGRPFLSGSAAA